MGDASSISDWTGQSAFPGGQTRKLGRSAVVRVTALVAQVQEADETPENHLVEFGFFRLNAMDDGQPDPVHVGNLLMHLMERPGRHVSLFCSWGVASVGVLNRPERGASLPPIPMLMFLPPQYARAVANSLNGAAE